MNVSRQAITKEECDEGLPDVSNLQELSKIFNLTVDYLLDNDNTKNHNDKYNYLIYNNIVIKERSVIKMFIIKNLNRFNHICG